MNPDVWNAPQGMLAERHLNHLDDRLAVQYPWQPTKEIANLAQNMGLT